ncbi:hypothetical protein HS088_TW03G01267 [Tripterygium wilfordii]|uniref:Protein FAR-RED-ELONGATED HYPOCOTYL 1-LIKE-like n=1 Tax=Tripterygium wilfordii TaxID=458696 RepID=A0A7J7DX80_TRIWF|nr:protein FAR-RED-ELONGATED HYPOCOTYL 1-LIKE [Tripterygium wilfordii]KAF5750927.1 hypothetical protein HS088_TW03G01267 [Tripterygium wilfordii]
MDEDNRDPSEIDSFYGNQTVDASIADLSRKRKLQAEQLGLPLPKHKCSTHHISSEPLPELKINSVVEDLYAQIIKGNAERVALDDNSELESAKGSNDFPGDSDSSMSVHGEAMIDTEIEKIWPCDRPSTSSYNLVSTRLKNPYCSSENTAIAKRDAGKEGRSFHGGELDPHNDYDGLQGLPFLEYGSHVDYVCSEYGKDGKEPDEEMENILTSKEVNRNIYVLSSGRWNVNQEAKEVTRKPTIDQEFEQYFSMLML